MSSEHPVDIAARAAEQHVVVIGGGIGGLVAARDRGALIYGECGGYMVLGETLTDAAGVTHRMAGLLPIRTDISRPRRALGYRRLAHTSALPWPRQLLGHWAQPRLPHLHDPYGLDDRYMATCLARIERAVKRLIRDYPGARLS